MTLILSRASAEQVVNKIADLSAKLDSCLHALESDIRAARTKHDPVIEPLRSQITELEQSLEKWAFENREEFGDKQSLCMTHGSLVFRKSNPSVGLLDGWTWKSALEKMQTLRRKFGRYIRKKEEIDRLKIRADAEKLGVKKLQQIGIKILQEENFSVEIKKEKPGAI